MRTYYESPEYESMATPGSFAAITIAADDDDVHFMFCSGDQVILDLPVPACESLAISYALGRAGKHAIRAAERLLEVEDNPAPARLPAAQSAPDTVRLPRAVDRFLERAPGFTPPAIGAGQNGRTAA